MPSKHGIWEAPPWRCRIGLTGITDIDISEADYTVYALLLTIANPSRRNFIDDCYVCFDLAYAGTGFGAAGGAGSTIELAVARKVDGTNYRIGCNTGAGDDETPTMTGAVAAVSRGMGLRVGPIGPNEDAQIWVRLSAEVADLQLPYFVYSRGPAPTITEVATV